MTPSRRTALGRLAALCAAPWTALPLAGRAQPQEKVVRLGLIEYGDSEMSRANNRLLLEGLRQRGYVEGRNLVFEHRHAEGHAERMPAIANELVGLKLDAIVTTCTPSTRLMQQSTQTIPLVMASVSDPVGQKLIASYARPGGNITGLASQFEDIAAKMLALFREAVPAASNIAVLFHASNPVHTIFLREMQAAAPPLGARLSPMAIEPQTDLAAAFAGMAAQGVNAVLVLPDDPFLTNQRRRFAELAARHRLPSFFGLREAVEDGGLMSYGESLGKTYFRAAYYVDKLVRGASAADIPVEQPTRFELVVNLKTARSLGLTVSQSVLIRADEVIQ